MIYNYVCLKCVLRIRVYKLFLKTLFQLLVVSIWMVVLATLPTLVFAGQDSFMVPEYHRYSSAFFNAFARPAWALCIIWVILACSSGYGGFQHTHRTYSTTFNKICSRHNQQNTVLVVFPSVQQTELRHLYSSLRSATYFPVFTETARVLLSFLYGNIRHYMGEIMVLYDGF